jgi:hypothetical protein
MPNLSGSTTQNQTVVNVYPTLQLSLQDLGLDTVSASQYLYPRGGTNNLITGVTSNTTNVAALQQKTTPLSYNTSTQRLSIAGACVCQDFLTSWPNSVEVDLGLETYQLALDTEDLTARLTQVETVELAFYQRLDLFPI